MRHSNLIGDDLHSPTNIKIKNGIGSTIPAQTVVKAIGSENLVLTVSPITSYSDKPIGMTKTTLLAGEEGYASGVGMVTNLDTSSYGAGNLLFSDSSGNLTLVDTGLYVGTVLTVDAAKGNMFVDMNLQGAIGPAGGAGIYGVVLIEGNQATQQASITAALAAASSGDVVALGPGTYAEDIVVPAGVGIVCLYGPGTALITGFAPTGDKVTIVNGSRMFGMTVLVPTDASGAIVVNGSARSVIFNSVTVGIGGSGIAIVKNNTDNLTVNTYTHQGTCDAVLEQNAGDVIFTTCLIDFGTLNDVIRVNEGDFVAGSCQFDTAVNATNSIHMAGDDTSLDMYLMDLKGATNTLFIDADNVNIRTRSVAFNGDTWDILVDPGVTSSTVNITSSDLQASKISASTSWWQNSSVGYSFFDSVPGGTGTDTTFRVANELTVGSPYIPSKINCGEGDAYTDTMIVMTNTNGEIGTWNDITTIMKSISGSATGIFPGSSVGNAFYIGSDFPFTGFKNVPTVAMNLGSGAIVWEYWDGAAWQSTRIMASEIKPPLTQYGNTVFQRVQAEHTHIPNLSDVWLTKTLNSQTKYWLRARISSAITTIPVVEEMKVLPNRMKIGLSGEISFFGLSRVEKFLTWGFGTLYPISGATPSDETLPISANIQLALTGNEFRNSSVDARGGVITIPFGLDTSVDLNLTFVWFPLVDTGGNVELEVDYAIVPAVLNGTATEFRISKIVASPTTIGQLVTTTFSIPVSTLVPGDRMAIRFFRDATGGNADDTLAGSIAFASTRLAGTFWKP